MLESSAKFQQPLATVGNLSHLSHLSAQTHRAQAAGAISAAKMSQRPRQQVLGEGIASGEWFVPTIQGWFIQMLGPCQLGVAWVEAFNFLE